MLRGSLGCLLHCGRMAPVAGAPDTIYEAASAASFIAAPTISRRLLRFLASYEAASAASFIAALLAVGIFLGLVIYEAASAASFIAACDLVQSTLGHYIYEAASAASFIAAPPRPGLPQVRPALRGSLGCLLHCGC